MPNHDLPTSTNWLELVKEKAASIRFGTVNITVHEGKVTIVEAVQKTRIIPDKSAIPERPKRSALGLE